VNDERDLPTIKQICAKADMLAGHAMDDEEAKCWFARTVEENHAKRKGAK
jgi:hypothetical protein